MAFEPIINKAKCQKCHNGGEIIAYLDVDTHLTKAESKVPPPKSNTNQNPFFFTESTP